MNFLWALAINIYIYIYMQFLTLNGGWTPLKMGDHLKILLRPSEKISQNVFHYFQPKYMIKISQNQGNKTFLDFILTPTCTNGNFGGYLIMSIKIF